MKDNLIVLLSRVHKIQNHSVSLISRTKRRVKNTNTLRVLKQRTLLIALLCVNAPSAFADWAGGNGGNSGFNTGDQFGINGGAGGGGGGGGTGGLGSPNVLNGNNGSSTTGGNGSSGNAVSGGTPGNGGSGGRSGTSLSPIGAAGTDGGDAICNGCKLGNGGGGGGGGGVGFQGDLSDVFLSIIGGRGGNGGNVISASSAAGADGGGGGGGGVGAVLNGGIMNVMVNITGGNGGNGGSASLAVAGGGAGAGAAFGGAGGSAIYAQSVTLDIGNYAITGGNGGNGGNGGSPNYTRGRYGSSGGAGIAADNATLTNHGTITGGNAGSAGQYASGPLPVGGMGVTGKNINIINNNSILGGYNADGATRNYSVYFTEGVNSLELQKNWFLDGNISANSGTTNKFILGGATTDLSSNTVGTERSTSFNVSQFGSKFQGFSSFYKTGLSTWQLLSTTGAYTPWTLSAGVLQIATDGALGNTAGALTLDGGTLQFIDSTEIPAARDINITQSSSIDTQHYDVTINSAITGNALTKNGSGTLALNGTNTYNGTTINQGTLEVRGNAGSISGDTSIANNAILQFNRSGTLNYGGSITGEGALNNTGSGTVILTAESTYTGGTAISGGTLQLGNGGTTGSVVGDIVNNSRLSFKRNNTFTYDGTISGNGEVLQTGTGNTLLTGSNTYLGMTSITSGGLYINGDQSTATGLTTVSSDATLGGDGIIGGDVTIADGGIISPGALEDSVGELTINGNLTLSNNSVLDYNFGLPYAVGAPFNDLLVVKGDLVLDGIINASAVSVGSFGPGIYRVIDYVGSLINNGLKLGDMPPGSVEYVQTSVANQVNLVNTTGLNLNMWDGAAAGNKNNGEVNGGNGIWQSGSASNDNWTVPDGKLNASWQDGAFAIFQAEAGNVTVDNSLGQVTASGMQFASDGYTLSGAALSLLETEPGSKQTIVRVGNGSPSRTVYTATIDAILQGDVQLVKTDSGSLVLNGINTYTRGTAINGGTVHITSDSNLGQADGGLSFNGGSLATNATITTSRTVQLNGLGGTIDTSPDTSLTMSGNISGAGALTKTGEGLLNLTGENTYSGGTFLSEGTLQVGNGGSSGSIVGNVTNDATLTFNRNDMLIYDGVITGSGQVNQLGTGSTVLTANNAYDGLTTISAGTLQLGNGGNSGSLTKNVINNGILAFNRSDTLVFNGAVSGNGLVEQRGNGTTILAATNTYLGDTLISAGTLQLGNGDTTGSIIGNVENAGTLAFNRSDDYVFEGLISGNGGLRQSGTGSTILTAKNTYSGLTHVESGTLQAGDMNVFSSDSVITVDRFATLSLDGLNQVIGGLKNAGRVNMGEGSRPGAVLRVKGDYVGGDGSITINSLLNGDDSLTDRLIIDGGKASGSTSLLVKTGSSRGGLTHQGIALVQTKNGGTTHADAFQLDPSSDGYNSAGILNVGAYNYRLKRGGDGGEEQDWYLISSLSPVVSSYLQGRQSAVAMHRHTLHDRQWQVPDQEDSPTWLRMEGAIVHHDGADEQKTEDRRWVLHGGRDIVRFNDIYGGGSRIGLMAQYGTSSGSSDDDVSSSSHSVRGYSAGIYASWFGHNDLRSGPYIDTWLMHGLFYNDVTGQRQRTENYRAQNTTVSLESGYKFKMAESSSAGYYIEPQAQILYDRYRAKNHQMLGGGLVSDMSGNNVTTRLGARFYEDRFDKYGQTVMQGFIEANWWHGPSSQTIRIDNAIGREPMPADRAEFKFGVQGNVMENLSVTGTVGVDTNMSSYKAGRFSLRVNYAY